MQISRHSIGQSSERPEGEPPQANGTASPDLRSSRNGSVSPLVVLFILFGIVVASGIGFFGNRFVATNQTKTGQLESRFPNLARQDNKVYPVTIRKPAGPPRVDTGLTDFHGNVVTVSCSSCHATREPNFANNAVANLNEFHSTLTLAHGTVSCLSCHNSEDYDALKLADGSRVEFTDVMDLCAQCHGPQMKDYEHGTHGGMNGYWDLTRGPRTKNNCVDCHNPHTPKFPKMQPTFKPRDRFLEKRSSEQDGHQ